MYVGVLCVYLGEIPVPYRVKLCCAVIVLNLDECALNTCASVPMH